MAFIVVGCLLVGAGILGFPLPKLKLWESKRESHFEIVHIEELPEQEMLKVENCESSI